MILLGDEVTVLRDIDEETTFVTGRVTGIVQDDFGRLKYFYIKGITNGFYMSDGWKFQEEYEGEDEDA
jgi:hypothetical protein